MSEDKVTVRASVRETVVEVVARELSGSGLEVDAQQLRDDSDLYADLGADDLDIITIVMALERELAVELPDSACDGVRTVGDLIASVAIAQARMRQEHT